MDDKELYRRIIEQLFKNGSCTNNQWFFIKIVHGEKTAMFEAICPSKGNIKIRKPIKRNNINDYGQEIWLYSLFRFTNKRELKDDGFLYDIRLDHQELTNLA